MALSQPTNGVQPLKVRKYLQLAGLSSLNFTYLACFRNVLACSFCLIHSSISKIDRLETFQRKVRKSLVLVSPAVQPTKADNFYLRNLLADRSYQILRDKCNKQRRTYPDHVYLLSIKIQNLDAVFLHIVILLHLQLF